MIARIKQKVSEKMLKINPTFKNVTTDMFITMSEQIPRIDLQDIHTKSIIIISPALHEDFLTFIPKLS